jgi:DNA-binding transcriptional regulator LsrR (DeoR family)
VPPPLDFDLPHTMEADINTRIARVNRSLLTVTKTQLNNVATVILVAGTLNKARAIYELLVRDVPKIDMLCVDNDTADALIKYAGEPRRTA